MDNAERQDVFNRVTSHLLKQRQPAISGEFCVYRGESGTKCAIGVLILDSEYSKDFEGVGVPDHFCERFSISQSNREDGLLAAIQASGVYLENDKDLEFLYKLQNIHDSNIGLAVKTWFALLKDSLLKFAQKENLDSSVLKE